MENNSISLELEEMRLQMATLQQQLNVHLKLNVTPYYIYKQHI